MQEKLIFGIFLIEKCANFNKNSAQLNDGKKVFYYMKKYHFRSRLDFFFIINDVMRPNLFKYSLTYIASPNGKW